MVRKLKDIKPLVIGIGVAGKRHLEAQLNLGLKTGIYSTNPQTNQFYKKFASVIVFDNLQDAIDWSSLVHICTPDNKHTEFVALALKKRKAVLCEKSFTTNLRDALTLQNLAHKYNSTLIVGQNYRLTPTFLETKKRVLQGAIGIVTGIETTYLDDMTEYRTASKWRNSQDFLYVGGSHAIDLALWIANQKVVSVQAATGVKIRSEYDSQERYQIILKFESGLLAHISLDSSSAQPISGSKLVVYGEIGQLSSHNKLDELSFYRKNNKKPKLIGLPNTKTYTTALEVKITDNYLTGKLNSYWPLPSVDEAIQTIKVLDAVQKAVSSVRIEQLS